MTEHAAMKDFIVKMKMIIKYRTTSNFKEIEKREITRETEKNIFYIYTYHDGTKQEVRELKRSTYQNWHNSFEDAREFIIKRLTSNLDYLNSQITETSKKLLVVESLTEDEK